jgi:putative oxidoreductase
MSNPNTNPNQAVTRLRELAARSEPYLYAALRIVAGALFAFHGAQKILGVLSQFTPHVGSQIWIGGVIELVGGTLIALGVLTRPVAFLASGQMAVAYTQFHWKLAFGGGMWLPAMNKGELAVIYCFLFLFFAAHGNGILALGARRAAVAPQRLSTTLKAARSDAR